MSEKIKPPAAAPCASCPYRQDIPSGVWTEHEYRKLVDYDDPTALQPIGVFMCHQQDGRLCAGWVGCHDMNHNLAIRFAGMEGVLSQDDFDKALDYETSVPLFSSGAEAAQHGMEEIEDPGPAARKIIDTLVQKRLRKESA